MTKILAVDDKKDILKLIKHALEKEGYEVTAVEDPDKVCSLKLQDYQLILLDVMMPGKDGFTLCEEIRDMTDCPILFLTARVQEEDRVNGLLSGGDDYIVKPFGLKELDARITAHLKREERHRVKSHYRFWGELSIDYTARSVQVRESCVELTKMEYDIIEFLSMHPGQVFDRERMYERICGYEAEGDSRVITELVRRIRKKLQQYTDTEYIETVWGMGYQWRRECKL